MSRKGREVKVGEWYEIGRGSNQYEKAIFDDVHKICMAKNGVFQTEEYRDCDFAEDEYKIERYEFTHMPKDKCEKRAALIEEIYKNEISYMKKDKSLVKQVEALDDELDISYHNGKYGVRH